MNKKIEEDMLEKYLKNITFGQAYELLDLGITLDIDYKNKKILSVYI